MHTYKHTSAHFVTGITIVISFCFQKYLLVVGVGFLIELVCHKLLSCLIALDFSVVSVTSNKTTKHSNLASQRASQISHARIQKQQQLAQSNKCDTPQRHAKKQCSSRARVEAKLARDHKLVRTSEYLPCCSAWVLLHVLYIHNTTRFFFINIFFLF